MTQHIGMYVRVSSKKQDTTYCSIIGGFESEMLQIHTADREKCNMSRGPKQWRSKIEASKEVQTKIPAEN